MALFKLNLVDPLEVPWQRYRILRFESSIIPDQFIDCRVVTAHRTGVGANVSAIKALCTADPVVAYIHDSAEVLQEVHRT